MAVSIQAFPGNPGAHVQQVCERRTRLRLMALVAAICASLTPGAAMAEADSTEWETRSSTLGNVGDVERPSLNSTRVQEQAAASLYGDARAYLNLAEWEAAQRILEIIVRRYPGTAAAKAAARDMKGIVARFRLNSRFGLGRELVAPDQSEPKLAVPLSGPQPELRAPGDRATKRLRPRGAARDQGWTAKVNPTSAPLQSRFQLEVGDRVFFGAHSIQVGRRGQMLIAAQAAWLAKRPGVAITIIGYSDEQGASQTVSQKLSFVRAEQVRALLVRAGVDIGRIRLEARGRSDRIAVCDSAACRAQNRRVEVRVDRGRRSARVLAR